MTPMEKITESKFYINQQTRTVNKKPHSRAFHTSEFNSDILDIRSRGQYPANVLSNFSKTNFVFDGVRINSIEGFLQALKVKDTNTQEKLCALNGFEAKKASKAIKRTKNDILLFWNGKTFRKDSNQYKELLKKVVEIQEKSPDAPFEFGGKKIASVNSFLLALKVPNPQKQNEICALPLEKVKEAAKSIDPIYDTRTLYWKGQPIQRTSPQYLKLLEKLYDTRFKEDITFRNAIRFSKHFQHLTHSIGKQDAAETILTEKEFISLIEKMQKKDNYFYKVKDLMLFNIVKKVMSVVI